MDFKGSMIDTIEYNVRQATVSIGQGNEEIRIAEVHRKEAVKVNRIVAMKIENNSFCV